jgi:hypothetical protein
MPFPSGTYINQIADPAVRAELEQLYSLFQGYLSTEHKDSGAHAAVTADSVAATGLITGDSDGRLPVKIGAFGTGISAGGLGDAGLDIGGKWYVRATASNSPGAGTDYEFQIWDRTNDTTAAAIRLVYSSDGWRLMHGSASTKTLKLGTSSQRIDEVNVLTANVITQLNLLGNASGAFTNVAYNAGDFTASAGTWTVDSADVKTFQYRLIGKSMLITFNIAGTDVSAGATLRIALPGGFTCNKEVLVPIRIVDNGTSGIGLAQVVASGTQIICYASAAAAGFAVTAADNTNVQGQIEIEVQ